MPESYSRSFTFKAGFTYALCGGDPSCTGPQFPLGASAMPGVNAIYNPGGVASNITFCLAGSTALHVGITLPAGKVYPYRVKVFKCSSDIIGLL